MASATLNPQVITNPNQGGTIAFGGSPSVTGHGSDAAASSVFRAFGSASDAESKSARWSSFQPAPGGTITSLHLKLDWSVSASTSVSSGISGSADAFASYALQYSLDGGSNWTNLSGHSASDGAGFTDSASTDITLLVGQTISNVQVRELSTTTADCTADDSGSASASATVTSAISNIRLEVVTSDPAPTVTAQLLVMM